MSTSEPTSPLAHVAGVGIGLVIGPFMILPLLMVLFFLLPVVPFALPFLVASFANRPARAAAPLHRASAARAPSLPRVADATS